MEIKSKKVTVNKNAEGLFNFLKDALTEKRVV